MASAQVREAVPTLVRPVPTVGRIWSWRGLLRAAAMADGLVLLLVGFTLGDREALAFGVLAAAGFFLLRTRRAVIAQALLGLLFADISVFMTAGAVSNITSHAAFIALAIPSTLAAISLVGLVAAVASLVTRSDPAAGSRAAPVVATCGAACLAVVLAIATLAGTAEAPQPSGLALVTQNAAFSSTALEANSGQITVRMANRDLFWHTFTIDALNVDLRVPVGAEQSVTFDAAPGTYTFYCAIPGHESIGMRGTLSVR